jgi:putative ABC transport system permease protein
MHRFRILRNVRLGIKGLLLHALRSVLTILGIVFGVGSVIAMLSVGEGASRKVLAEIQNVGSNNILLEAIKPVEDEQNTNRPSRMIIYGLTYDDNERIEQTIRSVRRTVPVKRVRKEGRLGERTMELRVLGTTPDWFDLVRRSMLAGRTLRAKDLRDNAAVCVLTEFGARRLLATEHTIGQELRIGGDYYKVVGIIQSRESAGGIHSPDRQVDAYIPLGVARERYGDVQTHRTSGARESEMVELHMILIEVGSTEQVEATAEVIEAMLRGSHKRKDYTMHVPLALLRQAEATKRTFNIVLGSIAGISLLVGGIGIMNIMLASVTERTREIGIRRAIGARRGQIIMQFLTETVVLSMVGGILGIGTGLLFPWLIHLATDMATETPLYSIVLSLGISLLVGVLFGLYPAARAARMDPITALRHE